MQENIMLLIKATLQQRMHGTGQFVFFFLYLFTWHAWTPSGNVFETIFLTNLLFIFFFISVTKIIFFKIKNIILIHFRAKNSIKNSCYFNLKHQSVRE